MDVNNLEFENLLAKFRILLKDNGLKYTFQREALLRTLYNANDHFTPENLYNEIKKQYPGINIGIATVYRCRHRNVNFFWYPRKKIRTSNQTSPRSYNL